MQILGTLIIVLFIGSGILVYFGPRRKPSEDKLEKQRRAYEELLKKHNVPEKHYKIVIGQSRVYSVHNCPAVIWKEDRMIKTLIMRLNPLVAQQEEEDFYFLASQPYVDFKRFDGTDYPDWAIQSDVVKEMFLPYVDLSTSVGGIDYTRQMYWIGTICVYPKSLAEIFTMLGKPLSAYENRVDNKRLMLSDGSLPDFMKEKIKEEVLLTQEKQQDRGKIESMEKAIRVIRDAERKAGEEAAADRINQLYARLLSEKRYEDLERATREAEYRSSLMEELGIGKEKS